ncbi:hypothetical protein DFH06DRAFT_1336133 [Mycena polygramma]|nr:hypothetical protein DFH06DRAFT_1336133 [Mycena polygramma]
MSDRRIRCPPLYYPSPGGKNTFVVDHDPNGRFYLVGKGHATGIFNDPNRANEQTDGFSGFVKLKAKRWAGIGGARQLWDSICDEYHRDGCPPFTLPNGFTAPTPVILPSLPLPLPLLLRPAPPQCRQLSMGSHHLVHRALSTLRKFPPAFPPARCVRLLQPLSSRGRPRVAPPTPVPASSLLVPATPRRREAAGTPLATPTSTPTSSRSRAAPRTPVAAPSVQPETPSGEDEESVAEVTIFSSDKEEFDYELPRVMWAVEGLAGEIFNTEDLVFASRLLSTLSNPRFMCSKNFCALDLFSRCLPDPDDDDFYV